MIAPRSALSQYERKTVPLPEMSIDALNAEEAELVACKDARLAAVRAEKARRGVKPASEDAQTVTSGQGVKEQEQGIAFDYQSKAGGAAATKAAQVSSLRFMSVDALNAEALRLAETAQANLLAIWDELATRGDEAVKAGKAGHTVDPDLQKQAKLAKWRAAHERLAKEEPCRCRRLGENGQFAAGWYTSSELSLSTEIAFRRGFEHGAVFAREFNLLASGVALVRWYRAVHAWRYHVRDELGKREYPYRGYWRLAPEHPGLLRSRRA